MKSKCRICLLVGQNTFDEIAGYKTLKCVNCGVLSVVTRISRKDIYYNNKIKYDTKFTEFEYLKKRNIFSRRAEKYIGILKKFKQDGNILDIGCSYGFIISRFRRDNFSVEGIDKSARAVNYATKQLGLVVKKGDFLRTKTYRNSKDVILLIDVLEHFKNPNKVLIKIRKTLTYKGIIIIQTPNYNSIMSKLTGLKWFWLLIPHHLNIFSRTSIINLMKLTNFKILDYSTWDDVDEFVANILFILRVKRSGKWKLIYYPTFIFLKYILKPLSFFWNKFYFGGELLIYAEKR